MHKAKCEKSSSSVDDPDKNVATPTKSGLKKWYKQVATFSIFWLPFKNEKVATPTKSGLKKWYKQVATFIIFWLLLAFFLQLLAFLNSAQS